MNYIVSFCVPVLNRPQVSYQLVNEILRNPNPYFQVVVSDNLSDDNTKLLLDGISDSRLKVVSTQKRVSATENWFNALENGDGKYLYFIIGRDKIDSSNIDLLIDYLREADEENLVYLFDRNVKSDKKLYICRDKEHAYINLVKRVHPTGSIFRKKEYRELDKREEYFQMNYAYPENFVRCDLIKKYKTGYFSCCNTGESYLVKGDKSKFDISLDKPFWTVEGCTRDILKIFLKVIEDNGLSYESRLKLGLHYLSRIYFYDTVAWEQFWVNGNDHYSLPPRKVKKTEKVKNILESNKYVFSKLRTYKWFNNMVKFAIVKKTIFYVLQIVIGKV